MLSLIALMFLTTFAASQLIIHGSSDSGEYFTSGGNFGSQVGNGSTSTGKNGIGHVLMDISPECMYDSTDFKIMGDSVERALNFFDRNVDKLVLDAAVSTRSLQAQLNAILVKHTKLPDLIKRYLQYLIRRADSLSKRIAAAIITNPKITYTEKRHNLPWVDTPGLWDLPVDGVWEPLSTMQSYEPVEGINATQILAQSQETIEEAQSDACIYQVFNCDYQEVSETCRKLFFVQEQSLYSLTHQVIYTLFAKKKQCYRAMSSDELKKYQDKLCGKVWLEANAIFQQGFPPSFADLFVEQVAICGMTGYPNFFRRDWLMQILRWQSQKKSGCFLDARAQPPNSIAMLVKLYHQNQKKFHELVSAHFQEHKSQRLRNKVTSRQKRSDAFLRQGANENCSVHFTAVGVTALGVHMRYFVDTCFPMY